MITNVQRATGPLDNGELPDHGIVQNDPLKGRVLANGAVPKDRVTDGHFVPHADVRTDDGVFDFAVRTHDHRWDEDSLGVAALVLLDVT